MSSLLSFNTENPSSTAAQNEVFIPFVAYVRLIPELGSGKRATMVRSLQKQARRIQQSIEAAIDDNLLSPSINIASPVAFTPQFGNYTARATIVGFVETDRNADEKVPTTNIDEIHSGTDQGEKTALIDGNKGGSLAAGQDTQAYLDAEVTLLRQALADALNPSVNPGARIAFDLIDIVHIEYNGVKYGVKAFGGRSFPIT